MRYVVGLLAVLAIGSSHSALAQKGTVGTAVVPKSPPKVVTEPRVVHATRTTLSSVSSSPGDEGPETGGGEAALAAARWNVSATSLGPNLFSGSLNSSFTIRLPRGRVDFMPTVRLVYDGGFRSANAGGWSVETGLAIERQRKFGVDYADDKFLVVVEGSTSELVPIGNDVFAPRYEGSFIRAHRTSDGNGTWWSVTDANGGLAILGRKPSTRIADPADPSRILRWNAETQHDVAGNYINYTYATFNDGNLYPQSIEYTGYDGAGVNLSPTNVVTFSWEPRPDSSPFYTSGFRRVTSVRLHSIDVRANSARERLYLAGYSVSANTSSSMLASLQQFGSDALVAADGSVTGTALPRHEYHWYNQLIALSGIHAVDETSTPLDAGYDSGRFWSDVDGDGRDDYCRRIGNRDGVDSMVRCSLSTVSGFGAEVTSPVVLWGAETGRGWSDFNGDGRADFCRITGGAGDAVLRCLLSSGAGFGPEVSSGHIDWGYEPGRAWTDVNGDGKSDYCRIVGNPGNYLARCTLSAGTSFGPEVTSNAIEPGADAGRAWVDVNGDGRADFCRIIGSGGASSVRCLLSGPAGFTGEISSGVLDAGYDTSRTWADVNGDGLADYCRLVGNTNLQSSFVRCTLSTGHGFGEEFTSGVIDWGVEPGRTFADVNGDGRADFCRITTGAAHVRCLLSAGDHFGPEVESDPLEPGGGFGRSWTDHSGDNHAGYCRVVGNTVRCLTLAPADRQPSDALFEVTNGLGGTTSISYEWSSSYANRLLPFRMPTLASLTVADGRGGSVSRRFSYSGGFYVSETREFRGFARVREEGPQGKNGEQRIEITSYHQGDDFSLAEPDPTGSIGAASGRPYHAETRAADGTLLHETDVTYAPDLQAPHLTPPVTVIERTYDVSPGAAQGSGSEVEVNSQYDEFGNRTLKLQKIGPIGSTSADRTVKMSYAIDTALWILHRPSTATAYERDDMTHPVEEMSFFYESNNCDTPSPNPVPTHGRLTRYLRSVDGQRSIETRFGYDATGNVTCARDGNSGRQTFEYDVSRTFAIRSTDALGHVTLASYYGVDGALRDGGLFGELAGITDANGLRQGARYDVFGRPIVVILADGSMISTEYIDDGLAQQQRIDVTLPNGMHARTFFDGAGHLYRREMTGAGGRLAAIDVQYDDRGLSRGVTFPYYAGVDTPRWTTYERDPLGRVVTVTRPDGSARHTCYRGNDRLLLDELGHGRLEKRDPLGRTTQVEEFIETFSPCPTTLPPPAASTSYEHGTDDRVTAITDAVGLKHTFDYDRVGRMIGAHEPDAGAWKFQYDDNGNLITRTDASGRENHYSYDALNRLVQVDFDGSKPNGGGDVTYVYDRGRYGIGRLAYSRAGNTSTTYEYDVLGRVARLSQWIGGDPYKFVYSYDPIGRLASLTYPDGRSIHYDYEGPALSRIYDDATDYARFAEINASSQVGAVALGNGIRGRYQFEPLRRRLAAFELHNTTGVTVIAPTYKYALDNNITGMNDAGSMEEYEYDGLDRLVTSTRNGSPVQYRYDPSGNITNGPAGAYSYDGRRGVVVGVGNQQYQYDANGNVVQAGARRIRYDALNRPVEITSGWRWLPRNRLSLVWNERDDVVRRWVYRGYLRSLFLVPSEYVITAGRSFDIRSGHATRYIGAGGLVVAEEGRRKDSVRYYHADLLGSVRATTDAHGDVAWRSGYAPFGEPESQGGAPPRVAFSAKGYESEFGLYRMGTRLYDPVLGRFLQPDFAGQTTGRPGTLNHYAYVHNNPVNFVDPTGAREAPMTDDPPDADHEGDHDRPSEGGSEGGNREGNPDGHIEIGDQPSFDRPDPSPRNNDTRADSPRNDAPDNDVRESHAPDTPESKDRHEPHEHPDSDRSDRGGGNGRDASPSASPADRQIISFSGSASFSGRIGNITVGTGTGGRGTVGFSYLGFGASVSNFGDISVSVPLTEPGLPLTLTANASYNPTSKNLITVGLTASTVTGARVGVSMSISRDYWVPMAEMEGELERHIYNWTMSGGANGN